MTFIKDASISKLQSQSLLLDKMYDDIGDIDDSYYDDETTELCDKIDEALYDLKCIIDKNIKEKEQLLIEQEKTKERKPRIKKSA